MTDFNPKTNELGCGFTVLNMTPHTINVLDVDGRTRPLAPSGFSLRVNTQKGDKIETVMGIEIFSPDTSGEVVIFNTATKEVVGDMSNIPEMKSQILIVSGMVGAVLKREDILVPMTAPSDNPLRNEKGHIVAVRGLKRP